MFARFVMTAKEEVWMSYSRSVLSALMFASALALTASRIATGAESQHQARVAVAANFTHVAQLLANQYAQQSGNRIDISAASTGKLYAQIRNAAPFDILLAADNTTPQRLVAENLAVASSLFNYATGELVLWSRDAALATQGENTLRHHVFHKFAIANPELAPYGAAAREALQHIGRWDAFKPHLVYGENVGQATQFVISGNAEAGLLPLSLVMESQRQVGGAYWSVPSDWHAPIVQTAVLLTRASNNVAAIGFLKYLHSEPARRIIRAHGYQ